jgi:hypothetical protein
MITPSSSETTQHLARLAQRLRTDRAYMASLLVTYQEQESLDEIELAARLSMNAAQVPRLALCKRPLPESNEFTEQIKQIASFTGADEFALAQIIQQVTTLEQFDVLPDAGIANTEKRSLASSGMLAAARDREDSEDKSISDEAAESDDKTVS